MCKTLCSLLVMLLTALSVGAQSEQSDYYAVHGSAHLLAMKEGSGYRLYDNAEKQLLSTQIYDTIQGCYAYSAWENKVVVVGTGGRFGLIDAVNGNEVLAPAQSPITTFTDGIYITQPLVWNIGGTRQTLTSTPVRSAQLWGLNRNLNFVVSCYTWNPQTSEAGTCYYGYCDREGREAIPPQYSYVEEFNKGIAVVAKDNKYGTIDTTGKPLIPFEYDAIKRPFSDSRLLLVKKLDEHESLNGLTDYDGRIIIPCKYNKIELFSQKTPDNTGYRNLYIVSIESDDESTLYGLMDEKGNELFAAKYRCIDDGSYGRFVICNKAERVGMADSTGRIIVPMIYDNVHSADDPSYILVFLNDKCGLVTPRHQVLIAPQKFDGISVWPSQGKTFIFASVRGKCGRINHRGQVLLPFRYDRIEPYQEADDGSMVVLLNGQWMRIDSRGKVLERYEKHPYEVEEPIHVPDVYEKHSI